MPSNIFAKVAPLLKGKNFKVNPAEIEKFLNRYSSGNWIYPSAMSRELQLDIKSAYEILELGVSVKAFEQNLEVYCPHCHRFVGYRYKTIFDIPQQVNCVHCDTCIESALEHAVVIYKVL